MSIIDRYISREILKMFLPMLGLLLAVFVGFTAATQLKDAVAGVIPGAEVPKLILLNTVIALEILLPTTLFFGSIAALGRMQSDFETLTMLSIGVTPWHITFTVLKLALLVSLMAAFLSMSARPWAYKLSYQLESETMAKLDIGNLTPREFISLSAGGQVLYARNVNLQEDALEGVFLQRKAGESDVVISARQARLLPLDLSAPPVLEFSDGQVYRLDPQGSRDIVMDFGNLRVQLPEEEKFSEYRRNAVPTRTLATSDQPKDIAEYQWRLSTPLLTLFLAALAVPLTTTRPRQSRSRGLVLGLVIYATVFGITSIIRTAVEQEQLAALPGMWLAPAATALLLGILVLAGQYRNRFAFRARPQA